MGATEEADYLCHMTFAPGSCVHWGALEPRAAAAMGGGGASAGSASALAASLSLSSQAPPPPTVGPISVALTVLVTTGRVIPLPTNKGAETPTF